MGNEFLAAGAEIMCPAGTLKIQPLKIPIEGGVLEGGRTVARETDCQPVTNIDSFGVCAITQQKCVPKYLGNKWMNTEEATFLSFNIPAPTMESYLFCMTGQLHVKPISSGQDMIKVDTLPEILLEMIKELLAFFHIEINEFDLDEDKVHELMMGNIAAENMPQATVPLAALVGIALTLLKNYLEDQGIEFGFGSSTSLPSADDLLKNAGILQQAEAGTGNSDGYAESKDKDKETSASIDDILDGAEPGRKTKGKSKQWEKSGGYEKALDDYNHLNPSDSHEIDTQYGPGKSGVLSDGSKVNVRPGSSQGSATLEVQKRNGDRIKIRYGDD